MTHSQDKLSHGAANHAAFFADIDIKETFSRGLFGPGIMYY